MNNFVYENPTKIIFGQGQISKISREIPAGSKVLITYGGGSVKKTGVLDEVKAALEGYDIVEFGGIEPNPTYETMMKAIEMVHSQKIDYLLAVGGGSVIDGTKFVAVGARYDRDPWEIMIRRGKGINEALPLGVVLTLPAAGSESNPRAVISRKSMNAKISLYSHAVFPRFAVLDPTKTYTLPIKQISNGVIDAFMHVFEQYMTCPMEARLQDRFAEGILHTLIELGPVALQEPENYDVRANLMLCATMALNGLIAAGVPQDWSTHMVGHELTALYGMEHASTLAALAPGMLTVLKDKKHAKLLQYGERIWGLTEGSEDERIDQAIAKTKAFFETMNLKTNLSDHGLTRDNIPEILDSLRAHDMVRLGEDQDVTPEVVRQALELSF